MNVLITGGTGFIGSSLAIKCMEKGDTVRVFGQENTPAEKENRKFIEANGIQVVLGSMTDQLKVGQVVEGIDVVFHLAAAQHEANVPDQVFEDVNVTGTKNILDASVAAGVKRFVHGSTIGVYGTASGLIDENTVCRPENIYGVTKLEGEKLALSFRDRIPLSIIRIPEVYGPGDRRLLKLFKAIQKNRFVRIGDGKNLHHLIFIDDLIEAFFLAAEKAEAVGKIFLLAGERAVTTDEMIDTIAGHLKVRGSMFRIPFGPIYLAALFMEAVFRPIGIQPPLHRRRMDFFKKSFELSWKKSNEILGYKPKVGFSQGVLETAKWYGSMGFIKKQNVDGSRLDADINSQDNLQYDRREILPSQFDLSAKIEPFDSFWEAPKDVEKGYGRFATFYRYNYLKHFPADKNSRILVISCGPGYMVKLLNQNGYANVLGIDGMPPKVSFAKLRNLNCMAVRAFDFLDENHEVYDAIFCEQEINHLTKKEILQLLTLCRESLREKGALIMHSLNGANPLVGSENLALNFDHYNTFTESSLEQIAKYADFQNIRIIPLKLYVFYKNPLNYVGIIIDSVITKLLQYTFKFYGKSNKLFTKKIAIVCNK